MPLIREQILYTGNDINFNIALNSNDSLLGLEQEIDALTQVTGNNLINPIVDGENYRFKNDVNGDVNVLTFYYTQYGTTYNNVYSSAGFSFDDIAFNSPAMLNSFYIFDYYDSYNINTQIKIFTSYITKIWGLGKRTMNNGIPDIVTTIGTGSNVQIYSQYVPVWYYNNLINSGATSITGYTKISFYNAKTGQIILFRNPVYESSSTPQKMYFTTKLDLINKTWKFINPATDINAKQLWASNDYIARINSTFTTTNNGKVSYPKQTTFNYITGKYD